MSTRVAGSLWSVPAPEVRSEAARLAAAGLEVWHWDRADGSLGPEGGFSPDVARGIADETGVRSEAHLMLVDPRLELDEWLSFCELVVVHIESPHWREAVERILEANVGAGIAVGPETGLPPDLNEELAVLIMTVAPGNAGSGFLRHRLPLLDDAAHHSLRGVDGSVDKPWGRAARTHGANWMVSGTALISAADPRSWLAEMTAVASMP